MGIALVAIPMVILGGCRDSADDGGEAGTDGGSLSGVASPPAAQIPYGTSHGSLHHQGQERTYRLYVPRSVEAEPRLPLVVALHGGLGSGDQFAENSQFEALAESEGFAVVFPDGMDRTWNAGTCCGGAARNAVDDVDFLASLVASLRERLPIGDERVFVTGHSNGAMMAFRLACERSDLVAAVAPVAGSLEIPTCAPSRGVHLLAIHGDSDRSHPLEGGEGPRSISNVSYASMEESLRRWTTGFGCAETPAVNTEGALTTTTWEDCMEGTTASLVVIAGADHPWPGGKMPERTLPNQGVPSGELDATRAVWEFFASR